MQMEMLWQTQRIEPRLGLEQRLLQHQRHEVELTNGEGNTAVPRLTAWLEKRKQNRSWVRRVYGWTRLKQYASLEDMLVTWMFPCLRQHCLAYYTDKGPVLLALVGARTMSAIDVAVLKSLKQSCGATRGRWRVQAAVALHCQSGGSAPHCPLKSGSGQGSPRQSLWHRELTDKDR